MGTIRGELMLGFTPVNLESPQFPAARHCMSISHLAGMRPRTQPVSTAGHSHAVDNWR
jgi:hypothetical protein